jgi:LytS/YehU family sensor histidine kinase
MIAGLSHLLRETLHAGLVDRVPLRQELELLGRYVDIQRARFGDRLHLTVAAADDITEALVPSLLLQPLVENAIQHGIGARAGPARIDIAAARDGAGLRITVADDGRGLPSGPVREGVGLGNCRARLRTLYGDGRYGLALDPRTEGGAIVRLSIPWEVRA